MPKATEFEAMVVAVVPSVSRVAVTSPVRVSPDKATVPLLSGKVKVLSAVGSVMDIKDSRRLAVAPSKIKPDAPKTPALAPYPMSPVKAWE